MDPLSITASIIAVLQATNAVISVCYDYSAALKHSSWELPKVIEEVKSLRNVLEALEQLAKAESVDPVVGTQLPTLKLLCEPDVGPLAMCLVRLEALEKKLAPPSWSGQAGSKRRALIQVLGWPLKEGDTKKILEDIGRFKTTLNLAITADQATMTQAMHKTALDVQRNFTQLHQSFMSMRIDDQREKIHRWLSPPDPSINHNEARKKRQAKSGTWFIGSKQFADWKRNPNSFLWLHGIPGCGKTILTSTIVEDVLQHCHLGCTLAVAYFYFDFNDIEKQQHEKMVRSLITHLSIQSANTSRSLESLFSSCMNGERQPVTGALLETLRQMVQEFDEVFIILDALDECKERQELLGDIEKIVEWKTEKLHILATSRRERDIEERIEPLVNEGERICIQTELVNNDIHAYVHERLQTDWKLRRWQKRPEVQQEIEGTLKDKADGMFRWAACQLDELGDCLNLPELREALTSLPITLDDTYARILCKIHKKRSQHALKILQWLAYSARPLRIEELVEVIAVDIEGSPRFNPERRLPESRDILTICSSLIDMTAEATYGRRGEKIKEQVRLAHFSVKEYLLSERIQAGPASWYSIREVPSNVSIAETCLAYLLQFEYPNSLTSQTTEEYPLARYAAKYWTQHAQAAREDAKVMHQLIMELFLSKRDAYVNWVRLSDPDRPSEKPDRTRTLNTVASPLYFVSLAGLVQSVRLLLEAGADVNAQGGEYGNALHAASARGHDQIVRRLLEKGADVNAQEGGWYGSALLTASARGHDRVVQRLLEKGANVDAQGGGVYRNALQAASAGGHNRVVQRLLEKGADVNAQGGDYGNALQAASAEGYDQIVQQLLEKGADVNALGRKNSNALKVASARGHDRVVQRLLEKGADVNAPGGGWYNTALQAASGEGHDQIVQWLLEKGADVNAWEGGDYGTALQAASAWGYDQIVQRLLEKGANVNAWGSGAYSTALQAASARGHDQVVQRLLEKGAYVNVCGYGAYGTALQAASAGGHDQVVQRLLEKGADVNARGGKYGTALQAASAGGHDQVVQWLLEKGADTNARTGKYGTALQAASARGHDQVVQRLLEKGADVNAQEGGQYGTALQAASGKGHDQIVQRLLDKGADVNAWGGKYGTALQAASAGGHDQVVQQLLEKGADVNTQEGGWYGTALRAASAGGYDQVVQRLLERGADVNTRGGKYGTALQAASARGHDQIVQLLVEKGADANTQEGGWCLLGTERTFI